jgi:hypothetical protein
MRVNINLEARESIEYKEGYVAFLDLLGFKELVFSQKDEDKEKIERYLGIVDSAIEYLKTIKSKQPIGYIVISDSIILSVPFGESNDENLDRLRHLCIAVSYIQYYLAIRDIWLRGAISFGKTYFDSNKNQIIGDGYINAYLLEESLAKYPRVILDNKIINKLEFSNANELIEKINTHEFDNCNKVLFDWKYCSRRHSYCYDDYFQRDIPLFIDYLGLMKNHTSNAAEQCRDSITDNIIKNVYKKTNIYSKFKWVSEYYLNKLTYSTCTCKICCPSNDYMEKLRQL